MAFTLVQLAVLEEAIAAGTTSVSYEGKSVTYRSLDEMLKVRRLMRLALGLLPQGKSTVLAAHDRAFPPLAGGEDE
jgi:hypothetical protein